jgi:Flp pilus assembly protein TadG
MIKIKKINQLEKGQIIPLVIVSFVVIIGMVALITDGGAIMSNRRTAQAAADAGALAGAQRACLGYNDAKAVAEYYATVNNNATTALATVSNLQVTVNTTVEHPSFFAKIFGDPTLEASAEAIAGCYGVKGKAVIPVSWACYPNDGGPFPTAYGCKMQTLSWEHIKPLVDHSVTTLSINDFGGNPKTYKMSGTNIVDAATSKIPPEQIYIIFDGDKICGVGNICDLDGDGKNDVLVGGDRGYLYLDNVSTHNLKDFLDLPDLTIKSHIWLSGKSGKDVALINKMVDKGFGGQVVMIPVYNTLCNDKPSTHPACGTVAHASPPWPVFSGTDDFSAIRNQSPYYHIIAFAPFYISCVSKSGNCPGYIYADQIINGGSWKNNEPVIEGFFLSDYDVSVDPTLPCLFNLGNCTITLSK